MRTCPGPGGLRVVAPPADIHALLSSQQPDTSPCTANHLQGQLAHGPHDSCHAGAVRTPGEWQEEPCSPRPPQVVPQPAGRAQRYLLLGSVQAGSHARGRGLEARGVTQAHVHVWGGRQRHEITGGLGRGRGVVAARAWMGGQGGTVRWAQLPTPHGYSPTMGSAAVPAAWSRRDETALRCDTTASRSTAAVTTSTSRRENWPPCATMEPFTITAGVRPTGAGVDGAC